ncbi:3-deoxy-D-manno-octulosonic acid transferase [uncultured Desulfosarcina sp.]|uniref:3-deoxy-D-manno-octulosonic acid transferase n=1 Tax=uncultured Desulfosarcina sp. TaxID=218289 RepID=UPI0029C8946E|nr:3-deoxy-D-manno-octulosonic acid transferase [uncultured Desulfosarcina sp.]
MKSIARAEVQDSDRTDERSIWVHALSVGEVLSAEPLVKALAQRYGAENLVFTASTRTGFQTAERVIAAHVSALRYFPYDTLFSVKRALAAIQPRIVVIVETDIWPNFLYAVKKRRIPVQLVNARLSTRSFNGYWRLGFMMKPLLSVFDTIGVQSDIDRQRFRQLGVPDNKLVMVGNMKFDQAEAVISEEDRRQFSDSLKIAGRHIWVAGSTHEGEEALLCQAYRQVCGSGIDVFMVIAPRDPQRAAQVCGIFRRGGVDADAYGEIEQRSVSAPVVVIDRIGMLRKLYALADVAFVGGSLVNAGGHNPLEPASAAKAILFGPHTEDFSWICQTLENEGGAIRVSNSEQLAEQVCALIENEKMRLKIGRRAYGIFCNHRGAVDRIMTILANKMESDHGRTENHS